MSQGPRHWREGFVSAVCALGLTGAVCAASDGEIVTHGAETRDFMRSVMGSVLPPAVLPEDLPEPDSRGAQLLQRYCVQCHGLPGPGLHSADEWPGVIARMVERMSRLSASELEYITLTIPTQDEQQAMGDYLQRHGYRPIDLSRYPDIDSPNGEAFRSACSLCHALPDPGLHTAEEWHAVVLRMRKNMQILGVADPGDTTIARTIGFLQAHAQSNKPITE